MREDEKQALIGLCRIEIKRWKGIADRQRGGFMVELMEIALASLTADGRVLFTCNGCGHEMFDEHPSSCDCLSHDYTESRVYTTPPAPSVKECEWHWNEYSYHWWSSCGGTWLFNDGGPVENDIKFCQCCGKPVRIVEEEDE